MRYDYLAFLVRGGLILGIDADLLLAKMLGLEADDAVYFGEKRVVLTPADVHAGMVMGAALTHEDVAGEHELTVRTLEPEPLGRAVAPVAGAADALLVREELQIDHHRVTPPFRST